MLDDQNLEQMMEQVGEPVAGDQVVQDVAQVTHSEEPQEQPQQESNNARNIRALRERAERADRAERERDQMMQYIAQMQMQQQAQQPQQEPEDDLAIDPDQLVEGKVVKKLQQQLKQLKQDMAVTQQKSVENTIRAKYSDFDAVVNPTNIQMLREQHPELANTINSAGDLYSKAVSAYTMIKNLGIAGQYDLYNADRQRAQNNAAKPKPVATVARNQSTSPLTHAPTFEAGLTPEIKAQMHAEMLAAMRNR